MAVLKTGDLDELRQLLSSGADLNSPGKKITLSRLPPGLHVTSYPLIWAVDVNNFKAVRLLLDSGADPNICCEFVLESQTCWLRPLCHAADPRIAAILLDAGAEVNALQRSFYGEETALLRSAYCQPFVGELLIEKGADVNSTDSAGCTALYHAIDHEHNGLASCLVQVRCRITS